MVSSISTTMYGLAGLNNFTMQTLSFLLALATTASLCLWGLRKADKTAT